MKGINAGFAICGSFCTFSQVIPELEALVDAGVQVIPIMSRTAYETDTRFGKAEDYIRRISEKTGREIIHTIEQAEPIGPRKLTDIMIIAPCTGNTLAKLAAGVTDTPVTMAAKAHLRNGGALVIAIATNDGLAASAKNIGMLMNVKNVYFVPFAQDDCVKKPNSLVARFSMIQATVQAALSGVQIQPVLLGAQV